MYQRVSKLSNSSLNSITRILLLRFEMLKFFRFKKASFFLCSSRPFDYLGMKSEDTLVYAARKEFLSAVSISVMSDFSGTITIHFVSLYLIDPQLQTFWKLSWNSLPIPFFNLNSSSFQHQSTVIIRLSKTWKTPLKLILLFYSN